MRSAVQIIYLNGPSSSGKTTLAKALQHEFDELFLRVGIDELIEWMPEKVNDWTGGEAPLGYSWKQSQDEKGHTIQELQIGPYAQQMGSTFRAIVVTLAKLGHYLIIDDVALGKEQVEDWKEALRGFSVLWIGVHTPLPVLEQRERERGNRMVGSARDQARKVHIGVTYDLEINTHTATLRANIDKICSWIMTSRPSSPCRSLSRIGVYGVAIRGTKILLVTQPKGPYKGKLDFPGGGIEFGETVTQTLHREFFEEVSMSFETMALIGNLTACIAVETSQPYMFHHIGLIYSVQGLHMASTASEECLERAWVDIRSIQQERVSPFVWEMLQLGKLG